MIGLDNNNNDEFDFFGIKKKSKAINAFNFGPKFSSNAHPQKIKLNLNNINFIGKPVSNVLTPRKVHEKPVKSFWGLKPLYKKESINQKHLSRWGDADMDGSPNAFDCDPTNWLKDAKKIKNTKNDGIKLTLEDLQTKEKGKGKSDSNGIRTKKIRKTATEKSQKAREEFSEALKRYSSNRGFLESKKLAEARGSAETSISKGKRPKTKYIKMIAEAEKRQIVRLAPKVGIELARETELSKVKEKARVKKEKEEASRGKKLAELETPYKTRTELAQMTKGERKKYETATSPKAIEKLKKERKKIYEEQKIEKRIEKEKERHAKVEQVKRVITGKAAFEALKRVRISPEAIVQRGVESVKAVPQALRATYGKEERVATQKVRRLVKAGLGGVFGADLLKERFGPAIRGRPGGPSGKYMIEGKPAFEEEYQKWAAQQRALNRLTPSTRQQAPITQEQQIASDMQQAAQQVSTEEFASTSSPMTPGEIEASKQMVVPQRGVTSEEIKMAQELAQKQDSILNAPNFLKGELKATGGSLLTSTGPQIMDAPNAFKGQLRTLNRGDPASIGEIHLSERPQVNPTGSVYLDIDLGSGKPILKKRTSEAWIDGRAL